MELLRNARTEAPGVQAWRFVGLATAVLLVVVLLPATLLAWLGATRYTWSIVAFGSFFIALILLPALFLTWINRHEPGAAGQLVSLLAGAAVAFTVLFVQILEDRARDREAEQTSLRLLVTQRNDLRGIDLSNQNLSRAYLYNKDFREALFHETNLKGAVLSYAKLQDAQMHHAFLNGADLTEAKMNRAELKHARLNGANLSEANLQRADLSHADLRDAILRGADFTGAVLNDVKNADWTGAIGGPNANEQIRDPRLLQFHSLLKRELPEWDDSSRSTIVFFQEEEESATFELEVEAAGSTLDAYVDSQENQLARTLPGYERQYSRAVRSRDGSPGHLLRLSWRHGNAHPTEEVRLFLLSGTNGYEYVGSVRSAKFVEYGPLVTRIFSALVDENVFASGGGREGGGGG